VVVAAVTDRSTSTQTARRSIFSLILFGIAFGYVEAAIVVYLSVIGEPLRAAVGLPVQELFPLLRLNQLTPAMMSLVRIELAREAFTLIMIWAVSRTARNRLGAFVLAFGVWDLTFYLWLRVLIGWPPSLLTWDVLFLLPVPWAAPVLAPVLVAATMTAFGVWLLARDPLASEPRKARALLSWFLLSAGSVVLLISFLWDWRRWLAGGAPQAFPWLIFAVGEVLVIAGFLGSSRGAIFEKNPREKSPERNQCQSSITSVAAVERDSKSLYSSLPPT
jgi:hypothetical protein